MNEHLSELAEAVAEARRHLDRVDAALAATPEPRQQPRTPAERQSYNLAVAFQTHKRSTLGCTRHLDRPMTNNQAGRDLRPAKPHPKASSCFKSNAGAERFAHARSYLSTTPKNDIGALDALIRLFNDDPWTPQPPTQPHDEVNGYRSEWSPSW